MWKLKNICLENLTNDTVYNIAFNLGYPFHYPEIEVNKYLTEKLTEEFIKTEEFQQEIERCNKVNEERLDQFEDDIFNWLKENNYLEGVEE